VRNICLAAGCPRQKKNPAAAKTSTATVITAAFEIRVIDQLTRRPKANMAGENLGEDLKRRLAQAIDSIKTWQEGENCRFQIRWPRATDDAN
jgi:hypothetical protein